MNSIKRFNLIGHRGFGPTNHFVDEHEYPENTLKSFKHVLNKGADGIELDMFLSADGVPIVIHDMRLHNHVLEHEKSRAMRKSVRDFTLAELQQFTLSASQRVPTLQAVFDLLKMYSRPRIVNLDVKDPNAVSGIMHVLNSLPNDCPHKIIVSSYNWTILKSFRRLNSDLNLAPAIKSADLFGVENLEPGTYQPLTNSYLPGFERKILQIHDEICALALDCAVTDFTVRRHIKCPRFRPGLRETFSSSLFV